jgi:nicotinamidase-related amidase
MVVDVQNGFITDETCHVVPAIAELAGKWQRDGGQVLFSRYFNYPGSEFERLMDWRKLYGPPDTDLASELKPSSDDSAIIIDKRTYSALTDEALRVIHRHGWTDIVICGIDTELCVLATAFDGFDNGLTPWVVGDASASTGGLAAHDAGLLVMARGIGDQQIVRSERLLNESLP